MVGTQHYSHTRLINFVGGGGGDCDGRGWNLVAVVVVGVVVGIEDGDVMVWCGVV